MHFVEEMGLMFEMMGMPRMAGRVFGLLLISDPPQQSSSDLAEGLQASKGSISSMTRLLIQIGLIERVGIPGERRDYFQIKPHAWGQLMEQQISQVKMLRQLAERGLQLVQDEPPRLQERLKEMHSIYTFWEQELPQMYDRWELKQHQSSS
jgi:DNA-binding transcriptional regulator GbsR (MarR family)